MPSLVNKRGRRRYVATPWYKGVRGKVKLMPDASKKSYREAVLWEKEQIEELKRQAQQTDTDYLTVLDWSDKYLDYAKKHFVNGTYQEKRAAFKRFVAMDQIDKSTFVHDIMLPPVKNGPTYFRFLDPPLKLKKRNPLKQFDKIIIAVLQNRLRKPEIEKARFYENDAKTY